MQMSSNAQRRIIDRLHAGASLALSPKTGRYELAGAGNSESIDQRPVVSMLRDGVLIQAMSGGVFLAENNRPAPPPRRLTAAEQAAAMRAALPPARVALAFAGWPRGEDIEARNNLDTTHYIKGLPAPGARRVAELNRRIGAYRQALAREVCRYNEILTFGPQALSDYDLVIAFSGNALKACKGSLDLVHAHISFNLTILAALRADLAALGAVEAPASEPPTPDDFQPGQRCEIVYVPNQFHADDVGKFIIIAKINPEFRSVWAYEDKPMRYRTNRAGRRVVDYDPRCFQQPYGFEQLRVAADALPVVE